MRLDTPPPEAPVPGAAEEARQGEAALATTLARTAVPSSGPAVAAQLDVVAAQAQAHADALGGVWAPWPDGVPEGVDAPEPPVTAAPATAEDVLALLAGGAASARAEALTTPDDTLAATLAATSISRAHAAADLAAALGVAAPALPEAAPLSREALLTRGADGPTVLVLDAARYALETVAARSEGSARDATRARAVHLRSLVDAALEAGAPDGRLPAYDLGTEDAATAAAAEQRLLEHWLFSLTLVAPGEREALVAAAQDAADRVRAWGGELGPLPGLS